MALPDVLPIQPFTRPVSGEVTLPGSKSLTNRALLLAALCQKPVTLTGALFSEDTQLMAEALRKIGFTVDANANAATLKISGNSNGFNVSHADLFVGLAGTAARFLTALCAAAPRGVYRIDGVEQMRKRPMKGLIDALRRLGADIRCLGNEGFFPIEIHASGLRGGAVQIDARESSQLLSALLMASPLAREAVEIEIVGGVRWPFVQMTTRLMEHFGQPPVVRVSENQIRVEDGVSYSLKSETYAIEPDATAASYFLALPLAVGGKLRLPGLRGPGEGLQGDTQFANVLKAVGVEIFSENGALVADFSATQRRKSVQQNFSAFSDTFLTLAALSPLLDGPTKISGIAHTRKQETDRVSGMARELTKLGQQVVETDDALEITPRPLRTGQTIETYHDHRFAMSFGILGSHDLLKNGQSWLSIANPACCAKTFPNFFELLESLRQRSVKN
ncbi:MAG TPA: 3-phosphoshikimate 1-carboxyvinyltransferase [Opitutaceae bacterium]|nr:3-phosphoshikimate 1-carboxyvinyltransferase [Opitutaceae bacterium]